MITGTHAIIYATDPVRARAFFAEVLDWPHVDVHDGWLIFKMPPAELGIHPTDGTDGTGEPGEPGTGDGAVVGPPSGHHEVYLLCDDVVATLGELEARGVEITAPVENQGFGLLARIAIPGAGEIGIYQPRHQTAYDLAGDS
jgi:predicted enzyme related to lactoylglutathione lyase